MWFKNLCVFQLQDDWQLTAGALEALLTKHPLLPCSGLNLHSQGFVAPREGGALVESADRHLLIALGLEDKLIPRSALDEQVRQHAAEYERRHGLAPGRKLRRELREQALAELAPRALARRRTVRAWIDPAARRLVVDTASPGAAEKLATALREVLESLPLIRPQPATAVAVRLTSWLAAGRAPANFTLGDEVELRGGKPETPRVRCANQPLTAPMVRRLLQDGLTVVKLSLHWRERAALTLDQTLQLRRLRPLETTPAAADTTDPAQRFDADLRLMIGDLGQLIKDLGTALAVSL
ncbi:MAG: recombination-associated protein RdgC [Gammaproteobacteria bacterium]|nr:recombination-associated protein RdgC [Gammaproteobacteria bacterium]